MTIAPLLDVTSLLGQITGTVALPGEPGYEVATPWNVAVPVTPAAVISVERPEDVAAAVRLAAGLGMRVAVQRTGHGAAPVGDDALLIHTGRLTECLVDPVERTARIGAGVVWQQVIDAAVPHGLAPLVGSSPGVGVVGFLTGGGIGPLVRTYGLSSDHVRAFELVTGEGRILRVTPDEHAELFWGLRGGKGSLGIVTAVEIDLVVLAAFYGGALYFAADDAAAVLHAWHGMCAGLPETANTSAAILQLPEMPGVPEPLAGRMSVAIRFAAVTDAEAAERLLAPVRAAATPVIDGIGRLPYAAIGAVHADPVDPMPSREATALLRELPAEAIDALLAVAGPGSGSVQTIVELRLLGGAMARPTAPASAFCHRAAAFNLLTIGVLAPPIAEAVPGHQAAVIEALARWSTGGELPNFGSAGDASRLERCYDEDTRAWLAALAERHDPAGVLRAPNHVR